MIQRYLSYHRNFRLIDDVKKRPKIHFEKTLHLLKKKIRTYDIEKA